MKWLIYTFVCAILVMILILMCGCKMEGVEMPSLIKCKDKGCPVRELCIRFTAPEEKGEKKFEVSPRFEHDCQYFMSPARWKELV